MKPQKIRNKIDSITEQMTDYVDMRDVYSNILFGLEHAQKTGFLTNDEKEKLKINKSIKFIKKKKKKVTDKLFNLENKIDEIREKCKHVDENGKSTLSYEGHDSHYDWYICTICGENVKG